MNEAIVGISLAYVVLAVLVVLLLVYTRWASWIKILVVLGVSAFYFVTYASLDHLLGWPTADALPKEFVVLSGYVKEPNESIDEDGAIYLWAIDYDRDNRTVRSEPRAYILPYSPYLHQQVNTANKNIKRGKPQVGRVDLVAGRRLNTPRTWLDERVERITIYDFPRQELPEK